MAFGARLFGNGTEVISNSINIAPDPYTVASWAFVTDNGADAYQCWASLSLNVNGATNLYFKSDTHKLAIYGPGGGNAYDPGTLTYTPNTWCHVAATVVTVGGGAATTGYLNGSADQSYSCIGTTAASGPFQLGLVSGVHPLNGRLADFAIWNTVLTVSEINALAKGARPSTIRPASLSVYWPLDGINSPEPDLSGNANTGILTGTTNASGPPVTLFTRRWSYSEIIVAANLVYARPDGDSVTGGWKNELEGLPLNPSIDEVAFDDADYIISSNNPQSDICKISLSNPGGVTSPCNVRYRYRKHGEPSLPVNMQVTLLQGSTTIAQWNHNAITGLFLTAEQTLSAPEFASISDFDDLYLQFSADMDAF